jgi:cellulose biosynthesis protein BcsQ
MSKRITKITVYSLKGGQGKTSIAVALAKELDFGIITNDIYSPIETMFPKEMVLKLQPNEGIPDKKVLKDADIIFDFGGYLDIRVIAAIEMSDYLIIPVMEFDKLNAQGFVSTIAEVKKYNKNIIIILNKINEEDAKELRKELKKHNYPYPVFEIKNSKVFKNMIEDGKPISQYVREGGLKAYFYKSVNDQLTKLIKYLTKGEK